MAENLVTRFYEELWNAQALEVANNILTPDVSFRSSIGTHNQGIAEVCDYITSVTTALEGYTCLVKRCISNDAEASALVEFKGKHAGEFLTYPPTGKTITWFGAAFFSFHDNKISDIWVLSDLRDLHQQLSST